MSKPSRKIFLLPFQGGVSFVDRLSYSCLVFVMLSCTSVYQCLVVTCWERADLLALVCDVQGLSEPEFYGDLVYKLKKIVGSNIFSAQFI